ncbi:MULTISPECIES: helix-turn-helix domain-containing protein [Sphingobacterium]|uniref:AraC family transcriptional regulator n=1 Tax=Sphingobacterium cellulitidis TaxID=1768011 RepID=A0A8H9FWT1_9SPHI|nr:MULTISPECIES: response regulator transcription factor [Sphingobacterium]MBA8985273.1 AraC-like DNA-binding protein [Sphingobacterium soli]OYD45601.1 AraC family transcriptional regulator [Sphingobacterium cellulitidis]WFB63698.1 helix-turn-helix transcriptional regulator [Sphingobacterium sp. WM]GGE10918.1 AraC family transcriptional regulator [Sphingobacterium soli]
MQDILIFDHISEYNAFNKNQTLHPLVSVVDLDKADVRTLRKMRYDFYLVFLKKVKCGDLRYGLENYDYEEGTLIFVSPGQVIGENGTEAYKPQGYALAFHPDLLNGTSLAKRMKDLHFFSYAVNEALHLSEKERNIILDCFAKIEYELEQNMDKHSKQLIVSNIELFLNYCERFYDRQFITREHVNKGILFRFEELLDKYFHSEMPKTLGIPSVAYCADQLYLSANYFGDLIKKETGKSPQEYIHQKLIKEAKDLLFDREKSINEIAYDLGFKYPQHFSRFFKNAVGNSPNEYRTLGAN